MGPFDNGTTLQTLIEHWNGHHWLWVASPNPAGASHSELFSVAADSPSSAWAVGNSLTGTTIRTLIEHWNGRHWLRIASPNPTGSPQAELFSVAAASRTSAWAVGDFVHGTTTQTLIEHWNGRHWRLAASPNPAGSPLVQLLGTAASGTSAWAVGSFGDGAKSRTLIEHWNGRHWRLVASPNSASSARDSLSGVTATSQSSAWAVGKFFNGTTRQTLIEQWNGRRWRLVASPDPAGSSQPNELFGVAAASSSSAWAVGDFFNGTGLGTLIERWNGTKWRHVLSPSP